MQPYVVAGGDGQAASDIAAQILHLLCSVGDKVQNTACSRQKSRACVGQTHGPVVTLEQRDAQLGFKLLNTLTDRRLGQVQLLCCGRERVRSGDREKCLK